MKDHGLEDLRTQHLTKKAAPKPKDNGGWAKNNARAKSGLNRAILDKGWHQFESFLSYKAARSGKVIFKVSASYTSQACAVCDYTHPDNRQSQSEFSCGNCGHTDKADRNAARNIKKQAIRLIKHAGTALSKRRVLTRCSDTGQGAMRKTGCATAHIAAGDELPKKKRKPALIARAA